MTRRGMPATTTYQLPDRLHDGRMARASGDEIAATVSAWLAELDAYSPLAEDFGRAVAAGDRPEAYAVGEHLSVDVTVAFFNAASSEPQGTIVDLLNDFGPCRLPTKTQND